MNKIYIAGSFSTEEERRELLDLIELTKKSHPDSEVYVPMDHVVPGGNLKDSDGNYIMDNREWGWRVFEMDKKAIDACDEVIALYRGRYSGTGTAWELGYAYGTGKKITLHVSKNVKQTSLMVINCADVTVSETEFEQK